MRPEATARVRTDELWRTTCFEAFVRTDGGYVEYNLSPSGAWAAYRFDGYREGMRGLEIAPPFIVTDPLIFFDISLATRRMLRRIVEYQ